MPRNPEFTSLFLTLHIAACPQASDPPPGGADDESSPEGLPLDSRECVVEEQAGVWGYKYQCNGAFLARIGATHRGVRRGRYFPSSTTTGFGQRWEPYERARVMACCGEYDYERTLEEQPEYADNCLLDFRQQACASLAAALATLIDDDLLPFAYRTRASAVHSWLASHQDECVAGFVDTDPDPLNLAATWWLPNEVAGGPPPWAPLEDVYVEIVFATLSPVARPPHAPPDGPSPCTSLGDNDDNLFTRP